MTVHQELDDQPKVPADPAPSRRRYREMLMVSSLTVLATLGGAAIYGATTEETPKLGYSIAIFQDGATDAGTAYRIEETRLVEQAAGVLEPVTSELGHFVCGNATNTEVHFGPGLATAEQSDIFNGNLGSICNAYDGLYTSADVAILSGLSEAGILDR